MSSASFEMKLRNTLRSCCDLRSELQWGLFTLTANFQTNRRKRLRHTGIYLVRERLLMSESRPFRKHRWSHSDTVSLHIGCQHWHTSSVSRKTESDAWSLVFMSFDPSCLSIVVTIIVCKPKVNEHSYKILRTERYELLWSDTSTLAGACFVLLLCLQFIIYTWASALQSLFSDV